MYHIHSKVIKSFTLDTHLIPTYQFYSSSFSLYFTAWSKLQCLNYHVKSTSRILPNYTVSLRCSQCLPQWTFRALKYTRTNLKFMQEDHSSHQTSSTKQTDEVREVWLGHIVTEGLSSLSIRWGKKISLITPHQLIIV